MAASGRQALYDVDFLDWKYVEDEIYDAPPEYREPKFYPLRHVVEIFSSPDPQGLTNELRDREARLSELIDEVVEVYHNGFAKSIQNYSQILQLFQESKQQVDSLKKSLGDGARQLGAQSKHLKQQWRKSLSLASSLRLLEDVQSVVDVPGKIEAALASKDYNTAVSLLLDGCAKLMREELMRVGALRKLHKDMAALCRWIQSQMFEELHQRVYSHAAASTSASNPQGPQQRSHVSHAAATQQAGRFPRGRKGGLVLASSTAKRSTGNHAHKDRLLGAVASTSAAGSAGGDAANPNLSTRELVSCLVQVDGIAEAKAYLNYHARSEIRRLVLRAAESACNKAQQIYHTLANRDAVSSLVLAVPHHVELLAGKLVQEVCDACLKALSSMAAVLVEVADAPATANSPALAFLREHAGDIHAAGPLANARQQQDGGGRLAKERNAYIKKELAHAWIQMQEEWQLLLSELLLAPLRSLGSSSFKRALSLEGGQNWLENFAELAEQALGGGKQAASAVAKAEGSKVEGSQLTFTIEIAVPGLTADQAWTGADVPDKESAGYRQLVFKALGDTQGTPYLTPAVYLPISSFVDAAGSIMQAVLAPAAADGPQGGSKRGDPLAECQGWLQAYMMDFVLETLLPKIWVDLRGRCTAALEHPDAFRPQLALGSGARTGPHASGSSSVLPAARFARHMLHDVRAWSDAMPSFELQFLGVADNILGRILDAFTSCVSLVLGDCKAGKLAARSDVAHAMACEHNAQLLVDTVAFYVPKGQEFDPTAFASMLRTQDRPVLVQSNTRVASKNKGFALEGEPAEVEVMQLLFKERPSQAEQLLTGPAGSSSRAVHLAALSESLDYVAEAIKALGGKQHGDAPTTTTGQPGAWDGGRRRTPTTSARRAGAAAPGANLEDLPAGLAHLVHRYSALSGQCVRSLRLELLLLPPFYLQPLSVASHLCEGEDAKELHPCIGTLMRAVARLAEDLSPHLRPARLLYVVGGVADAAARTLLWLLPAIQEINTLGVERMIRALSVLQPALVNSMPHLPMTSHEDAEKLHVVRSRVYDHVRAYYGLLAMPTEEVIKAAADKPLRYSYMEWLALLQTHVPGRLVNEGHMQQLQGILDKAHGLTAGQKISEVVGTVVTAIQTPAELLTSTVGTIALGTLDALKAGGDAMVAGALMPAQQIKRVFNKLQDKARGNSS